MSIDEKAKIRGILRSHARRYPLMMPQDAVKLVFQNEFGGGHLITDSKEALSRLRSEAAGVSHDPELPLFEDIGNGLVRVMLAACGRDGYTLEALNRDFVRSAFLHKGQKESFLDKLNILRREASQNVFGFSSEELEGYLESYTRSGCQPVSHSGAYREAYRPAYRVVLSRVSLFFMLQDIQERLAGGKHLLLAMDGRCASGKTTLAGRLQQRYGWPVIHMDHFFLRPEQRTRQRYEKPGENIDHERFLEEVLLPLREDKIVRYRPFNCKTQQFDEPVLVKPGAVTIIEGSYACHPELWPYYDIQVFMTVTAQEQMRRIKARDGDGSAEVFRDRWIPLEEAYISACRLEERCCYCLEIGL